MGEFMMLFYLRSLEEKTLSLMYTSEFFFFVVSLKNGEMIITTAKYNGSIRCTLFSS